MRTNEAESCNSCGLAADRAKLGVQEEADFSDLTEATQT
jgi:hypothetical protein